MSTMLERILKRDRLVVSGALVLVAGGAWVWLLAGAGMDMNAFEMTRHSMMDMPAPATATWNLSYAVLMFFMWWIMMVAMMLPSATPVVLLAALVNRRTKVESPPYGSTISFVSGYLLTWAAFSMLAVAAQWLLERSGLLNAMLVSTNKLMAGLLLLLAGVWQLSPWKHACLRQCRNPIEFLSTQRRSGNSGALIMGLYHGSYCVGCCWFLMALLFAGGVMNLYWIIGLTLYVWIEKVAPAGLMVSRLIGVLLIAWGMIVLVNQ